MEKKKELYSRPQLEIVRLDLQGYVVATSTGDGTDQDNSNLDNWA